MRTNIDIDDALLAKAMRAGPYTSKKETVEAGLQLLARQAAYREILKWKGKLKWEGDESIDWTKPDPAEEDVPEAPAVKEQPAGYRATRKRRSKTASQPKATLRASKVVRGAGR